MSIALLATRAAVLPPDQDYLLRHTFSGASLTPSDQGASLRDTGVLAYVSNGLLRKTTSSASLIVAALNKADLVVQWKTNFGNSTGSDRRSQIRVRHVMSTSRYNFVLYRSSNLVKIQRFDSGTTTTDLASVAYQMTDSTDYWTRAIAIGSRLELLVSPDGVSFTSVATATDTTYLTAPLTGEDFEIDLVDNSSTPTIAVSDLRVWPARSTPVTLPPGDSYRLRHTFSGASLTPSDQGPSFSTSSGTPAVSGGVLGMGAIDATIYAASLAADLVVQAKVNFGNSAGADRRFEIQARASAGNANTVSAVLSRSSNSIVIWRRDAGSVTTLATVSSAGLADSTNYWIRFVLSGSRLEVFTSTDGTTFTSRVAATESTYATNTGLALKLDDNGTQTITVDDLLVWSPTPLFPSGTTYLVRDAFNRADGSLGNAEIGGAWGEGVSSWTITNGRAVQTNTSSSVMAIDAGYSENVEVGALVTTGRATSNGTGFWLRANAGGSNRLALHHESDGASNAWVLYRVSSGAFTEIGRYSPSLAASGYTWDVKVRLQGSQIVVNLDGTDRITVTEATHQSQTIFGPRKNSSGDSACAFDNFYVRKL